MPLITDVYMSEENREMVTQILELFDYTADSNISNKEDVKKIISKLKSYGFTSSQISLGLKSGNNINDIIEYLCFNIPDDELPPTFRPTGQFEISSSKSPYISFAHSYGFKEKDIEKAYIINIFSNKLAENNSFGEMLFFLYNELLKVNNIDQIKYEGIKSNIRE